MKNKQGLTLIELLITIAIVGVIGVLASIAVLSARSKQRDATRLANVRQMQIVLEEFFNDHNRYPDGAALPLGDATQSTCFGAGGFQGNCTGDETIYLQTIPATLTSGLEDLATCGEPARNAFCYTRISERSTYAIEFELENPVPQAGLQEGLNCATPSEIRAGSCELEEATEEQE